MPSSTLSVNSGDIRRVYQPGNDISTSVEDPSSSRSQSTSRHSNTFPNRGCDDIPSVPPRRITSHPRRRHRRGRWDTILSEFKSRERNCLASICSCMVLLVLSVAMVKSDWFYVRGGSCQDQSGKTVQILGLHQFFLPGTFTLVNSEAHTWQYQYGSGSSDVLINCVTSRIIDIAKTIIAFHFLAIFLTMCAFFSDLCGAKQKLLSTLRRHAFWNIMVVIICILITGLCYMVAVLLKEEAKKYRIHPNSKVEIQFHSGFYLVATAGGISILAAACNLLCLGCTTSGSSFEHHRTYEPLIVRSRSTTQAYRPIGEMPPPPIYTP